MTSYLAFPLVQAVLSLVLLPVVLKGHHRNPVHRLFSLYLLGLLLYGVFIFLMRSSATLEQAYFWEKGPIALATFLPVVFYHFSVRFAGSTVKSWLLPSAYAVVALFFALTFTELIVAGMQQKPYGYAPIAGPLWVPMIIFDYSFIVMSILLLWKVSKTASSAERRNRSTYIFIGVIFSTVGGAFDILPLLGLPLIPGLVIGNIMFCLLATVAIVRYNLLDIRIIIRKGLAYALASGLAVGIYVLIIFLISLFIQSQEINLAINLAVIVLSAIALQPLLRWFQQAVDKRFYRDRYNYLKALEDFGRGTQSLTDSAKLGTTMTDLLGGALKVRDIHLLQPVSHSDDLADLGAAQSNSGRATVVFKGSSPLVKWLKQFNDIVSYADLELIPQLQGTIKTEKANLLQMGAELIVPIKTQLGQLTGLLILGKKLSEQPYTKEDGQLIYTVRGQMEVKLENARLYEDAQRVRRNLEQWLDNMTDSVLIIDQSDVVQFTNQSARNRFDIIDNRLPRQLSENISLRPWFSTLSREDLSAEAAPITFSAQFNDLEYEVSLAPLLDPEGTISILVVMRDITERKQVEEERIKSSKLESLGILAGGIAHDFNNILTGVMGNISLIKDITAPGTEAYEILEETEKASTRATGLTQQLLTFAKGGIPVKKMTAIGELIRESASFALRGSRVSSRYAIDADLWPVEVDEGQIVQVINNIVINAVQAMPMGGAISVKAGNFSLKRSRVIPLPAGNYLEISVEDQGVGISAEFLANVFDPYFTTKQRGSGLGLATCHSIVQKHDGHIAIDSEVGVGTKVTFYLPAIAKRAATRKSRADRKIPEGSRVLLMDDEEMIRQLGARMLKSGNVSATVIRPVNPAD